MKCSYNLTSEMARIRVKLLDPIFGWPIEFVCHLIKKSAASKTVKHLLQN